MITRAAYLVLTVLCIHGLIKGQDARADFKKINEAYNNTKALSMDIRYELFFDGSAKPYETETGRYVKLGDKYLTRQGSSELVINSEHMIVVDKDEKVLAVDKKIDIKRIENPLSLNLDSLFALYSKIEEIKTTAPGIKGYRFYVKQGPYSVCEVLYNSSTYFVTEIKNVFRSKLPDEQEQERSAVMKTTFYNVGTQAPDESLFSDSRYIVKGSKGYMPGSAYKSFTFINHLN